MPARNRPINEFRAGTELMYPKKQSEPQYCCDRADFGRRAPVQRSLVSVVEPFERVVPSPHGELCVRVR